MELIASYIIAKPDYKSREITTPFNEAPSFINSDDLIEKIRKELHDNTTLKKKNEKREFCKTILIPKYKEDLEKVFYSLKSEEQIEDLTNKILKKPTRTKRP